MNRERLRKLALYLSYIAFVLTDEYKMGMSHHGDDRSERELHEIRKRFLAQVAGNARREWSAGRMGGDDEGDLSYAMTTDAKRGVIVINYGKPVAWVGLGIKEAEQLRDELTERLMELRGVTT